MDEGETSFAPSSSKTSFPLVPSHHPPQLSHEVYHPHQQQQQDYPSYHKGEHHRYQQQQQQQCTGQQSSEVSSPVPVAAEYQSMNHLLGDLHAMRHRQRAGDTLTAHHQMTQTPGPPQMQQQQQTLLQYPIRPSKKVSLRVNSKLY
jgi:hypothetical protein